MFSNHFVTDLKSAPGVFYEIFQKTYLGGGNSDRNIDVVSVDNVLTVNDGVDNGCLLQGVG